VSELLDQLRDVLATFAASDPGYKRFGAAQHRYRRLPPLARTEIDLPDDYREYVTQLSAGGVGPYYGLIPADRAPAFMIALPNGRGLPLVHLGCGYLAVLVLDGPAVGQVWIDARAVGLVAPIRTSFTAFYLDWVDRVAHNEWLDGFVDPGRCAVTAALSGYLAMCERRLGIEAGTLTGEPLRTALGELGPGAIEVTANASDSERPLFEPGDRVDPCATCARALQGLIAEGLRADVVAAGVLPLPSR